MARFALDLCMGKIGGIKARVEYASISRQRALFAAVLSKNTPPFKQLITESSESSHPELTVIQEVETPLVLGHSARAKVPDKPFFLAGPSQGTG